MRINEKGMTLVELLTVVVVLGILASIAVPSYRSYLLRSQRSDASTALLRLQTAQEKFFLQKGVYTDNLTAKPGDTPAGLGIGNKSERGYYDLAVKFTTTGYEATATPVANGAQKDDKICVKLRVTERAGSKYAENSAGTETTSQCWR